MDFDVATTAINGTVNRQRLETVGMEGPWAASLAAAITALDTRYRLNDFDARWALYLLNEGQTDMTALALALRPLV